MSVATATGTPLVGHVAQQCAEMPHSTTATSSVQGSRSGDQRDSSGQSFQTPLIAAAGCCEGVGEVGGRAARQRRAPDQPTRPASSRHRMTPTYSRTHSLRIAGSMSRRRLQSRISPQAKFARTSSMPPRRALGTVELDRNRDTKGRGGGIPPPRRTTPDQVVSSLPMNL